MGWYLKRSIIGTCEGRLGEREDYRRMREEVNLRSLTTSVGAIIPAYLLPRSGSPVLTIIEDGNIAFIEGQICSTRLQNASSTGSGGAPKISSVKNFERGKNWVYKSVPLHPSFRHN